MNTLVIFAKAPVAGIVKTRLVPPLSYDEAARLYAGWAKEIYERVRSISSVKILVAYAPDPSFPDPQWICEEVRPVAFFPQEGKDLGEKIVNALAEAGGPAAAIGTDSPGLPLSYIEEAFRALQTHDLVLGPAEDGGYYLIGSRKSPSPELFRGVAWSGANVFAQTCQNAGDLDLSLHVLPPYFDIDRPEDLEKLKAAS